MEQRRENRDKDKPLRYKRSTNNKAAPANAALQARPEGYRYQVQIP